MDAREDAKWQRRRELMAKVKEQASSEEDENPAAPPTGGSVFTKALKVSEGLYQFSDDQMAGDFPCFDETTATRLRRLQAKDVQRLLRGFEGPQLKQGGLERVVEAFYIAKMKYEHEARLSTPGQQVGKRAGLGYGGLENRPLGKEPTSWICPCCTMPSSSSMGQFLITARTEEGTKSKKLAWSGFSQAIGSVASSLTWSSTNFKGGPLTEEVMGACS